MKCTLHTEDVLVKVLKIVFILCIVLFNRFSNGELYIHHVEGDLVKLLKIQDVCCICVVFCVFYLISVHTSCWMVLVLMIMMMMMMMMMMIMMMKSDECLMTPQLENDIDCLVSNKSVFMKHVLVVAHVFSIILKILQ